MKQKTAMQTLIEWANDLPTPANKIVVAKAKELLELEKKQITDAYSMGAIDEDLHMEETQANFTGAYDYYNQTYNQ